MADDFAWIRSWVEESPYTKTLGVVVEEIREDGAKLRLPFSDNNANPGKALHGGCAASLASTGGQTVTRAVLGEGSGPWHTCGLQVNYLAAAIGEDVVAEARLLRRGKEMCFVEVDVATPEGKSIAHATTMVRGRFGQDDAQLIATRGDDGAADPGPMGPHMGKLPFGALLGFDVQHMAGGTSRILMPWKDSNADSHGGVHEGAVLALFDTTGAMAGWAETGPGRFKASTPAIQGQLLAPAPKQDLIAYGRVVQRDADIFWSDVEVAGASDGKVVCRGTVLYRIVV